MKYCARWTPEKPQTLEDFSSIKCHCELCMPIFHDPPCGYCIKRAVTMDWFASWRRP